MVDIAGAGFVGATKLHLVRLPMSTFPARSLRKCSMMLIRSGSLVRGVSACKPTVDIEMDPYLRPGVLVPSLSADQCVAGLAQAAVNPPAPPTLDDSSLLQMKGLLPSAAGQVRR